jgi:hypothetical protein
VLFGVEKGVDGNSLSVEPLASLSSSEPSDCFSGAPLSLSESTPSGPVKKKKHC